MAIENGESEITKSDLPQESEVIENNVTVSDEKNEVIENSVTVGDEKSEVAENSVTVSDEKSEVAENSVTVGDEKNEVAENSVTVSDEKSEVASEREFNVATTVIKTLTWFITSVALLFGFFVSCFSYPAMKMYDKMGLYEMAFNRAQAYVTRHKSEYEDKIPLYDSRYVDALSYAMGKSITFLANETKNGYHTNKAKKYAKSVDEYVTEYIKFHGYEFSTLGRTNLIQEHAINELKNYPELHPQSSVSNYKHYILLNRFSAWYTLGDYAKINEFINSQLTRLNDIETNTNNPFPTTDRVLAGEKADIGFLENHFLLYDALNFYVTAELNKYGYYKLVPKHGLYESGGAQFESYETAIRGTTDANGNRVGGVVLDIRKMPAKLLIDRDGLTDLYHKVYKAYEYASNYLRDYTRYVLGVTMLRNDVEMFLRYTNYLKILSEFALTMHDLALLVNANEDCFYETAKSEVSALYPNSVWQTIGHGFVNGVWYVNEIGNATISADMSLKKWYENGMREMYKTYYYGEDLIPAP